MNHKTTCAKQGNPLMPCTCGAKRDAQPVSDTPRTDAAIMSSTRTSQFEDFARQLERDRAELRAALDDLVREVDARTADPTAVSLMNLARAQTAARATLAKVRP
jgi:predicted outer membrane protein